MTTDGPDKSSANDRLEAAYLASSPAEMRAALKDGANPNLCLEDSPLLCSAAAMGDIDAVEALLTAGADVNARGMLGLTPAMVVAWIGRNPEHSQVLERLIQAGADLSLREPGGRTALDLTRDIPNKTAMQILERAHAPSGRPATPRRDDGWQLG